ncbi:cytochrome c oxidase assembly factor Coa1 family protein [Lysobacter fragariae]
MPAQTHWFGRNWKWVVPVGCLSLVMLFVLVGALLFAGVFNLMKQAEPYRYALESTQRHPAVIAALGQPIEASAMIRGNIQVKGAYGDAQLNFPVSGPRGKATVYVEARKERGRWRYRIIEVDTGAQRINVVSDDTVAAPSGEDDQVEDDQVSEGAR